MCSNNNNLQVEMFLNLKTRTEETTTAITMATMATMAMDSMEMVEMAKTSMDNFPDKVSPDSLTTVQVFRVANNSRTANFRDNPSPTRTGKPFRATLSTTDNNFPVSFRVQTGQDFRDNIAVKII